MWKQHYDVLIVGCGVAGSALAYALATLPRGGARPLRICVLERSLAEPDRIVGELLQPGGVGALDALGMGDCLRGIDATPVRGYAVAQAGATVHIPYPGGREGRSFHHGRFIMKLREKVRGEAARGAVELVEATVQELVECELTGRVLGVKATRKAKAEGGAANGEANGDANGHANGHANGDAHPAPAEPEQESFFADLTVIADGCFSNFRTAVLPPDARKPATRSHFVGAVLKDAPLPIPKCGTVCLVKGSGPVLLYQIADKAQETRILIDVKAPLPSDLKGFITSRVLPQLPEALHPSISAALDKDRLRRMPNSFLPPARQGRKDGREGVLLLGDAWNMRHPLTGGGMTVAFNDALLLARELLALAARGAARVGGAEGGNGVMGTHGGAGAQGPLADWELVRHAAEEWAWKRRPLASTVNILSIALYDLFGAEDESLEVLRTGCFKYFERGGECINGPVSLLSAITPSPVLLFNHFFSVAFYSIWCMLTHARAVRSASGKDVVRRPSFDEYPLLLVKAFQVFWTACVVFAPLMWVELKWW